MESFSYLTEENLYDQWKDSEKSMSPLFDPFEEYERIARNRPHPNIDNAYPKVTDGTLSAIVQETPKRYIQQLPTGKVETNIGDWFDIFATWKLTKDLIPGADCQADPLQKSWRAGTNALTYGCSHGYVYMDYYEGDIKPNFKLPYITHVYLQKGKLSTKESNFVFLEAWYQETDIDYIIAREESLKKEDKKYKGEWDITALKEVKKNKEAKGEDQQSPTEREIDDSSEQEGIRIIHGFQRGVGKNFYSFVVQPGSEKKSGSVRIVRTKVNKDPRGEFPLHTVYCNLDLSNPLGRGIIELSGGMQNLLDSHTQAFQYMQALEMNPPLLKWGDISKGAIKYVPNAIIDMGNNPNNKLEPLTINTQAISNFPTTYGLIKSQILNLNNSSDTSVSSEVGNPGFSKTDAGVDALQARLGVSDNYLRKQYEAWWQEICETMLNLYFAEKTGTHEEDLDSKTADKLRKEIPEGNDILIWDDVENSDKVFIDYDKLGEEPIYFTVDASTSQVKEDQNQVEAMVTVKELVMDMLPTSKRMQLANKFIYKLGIEDPEDITFTKEEIDQTVQMEQVQEEQAMMVPEDMGADMPMEEMPEDPADMLQPEEEELIQALEQRGFPPQAIEQAVILMREGYAPDEIVQILMQGSVQ